MSLSQASGATHPPLIEQTLGDFFDAMVARQADHPALVSAHQGLQTAAGVPLQCDEGADFMTFRIGLFGLDKWHNVDKTVANLAGALDRIGVVERAEAIAA